MKINGFITPYEKKIAYFVFGLYELFNVKLLLFLQFSNRKKKVCNIQFSTADMA